MYRTDHAPHKPRASEDGIALLAVMMGLTVVGILALGLVLITKSGIEETSFDIRSSVRSAFFDAVVIQTASLLLDPEVANRPRIDGVPEVTNVMGHRVSVSVTSEFGKVDLNATDEEKLERLFGAAGEGPAKAVQEATDIVNWRANGGGSSGTRLFRTTDEIFFVSSVSEGLYQKIKGSVTVYSGRGRVDQNTAPLLALESTGMDHLSAEAVMRDRASSQVDSQTSEVANGKLVQGVSITGWAFLITSTFNIDGQNVADQEVIRLTGNTGQPYFVLWRQESCQLALR